MGARFEALDEGVLAAASKSIGYFFAISISQKVRCQVTNIKLRRHHTVVSLMNREIQIVTVAFIDNESHSNDMNFAVHGS